jgi:hypothetical protein
MASAGNDDDRTDIYAVDLETGSTTLVGTADVDSNAMAVAEDGTVYLVNDEQLFTFTGLAASDATPASGTPATETISPDADATISGLGDDEDIVGIDVRPATGELFAISDDGIVYVLDVTSGEATSPSGGEAIEANYDAEDVAFDFNPTVDRIRLITEDGANYRLNPDTGLIGSNPDTDEPTIDGTISWADGDANSGEAEVVAAGYTNSVADAEETQLYVIDAENDVLALQDPPNDGVLNTVGELGVDVSDGSAFDITADGTALLTIPD